MVFKYLTNIKRILDTTAVDETIMEMPIIVSVGRQALIMTQVTQQMEKAVPPLFDASGLLRAYRIRQWAEILPALRPTEAPIRVPQLLMVTPEEEEVAKRTPLGRKLMALEEPKRYAELLPEKRLAEIERLRLERDAIFHVEHLALALLERLLWTTRQTDVQQVLQQLLEMSEARRSYLTPILGLESLQKLMLTLYVPYFMETPLRHNMLGLMLTAMTLQMAKGKSASIYASMAGQGQVLKQKGWLLSDTQRVLRTKAVALSKKLTEWWQTIHGLAETVDLAVTEKIPLFTDFRGSPLTTVTLLQALGHKYLISAWYARHIGFPENKWYLAYPRLEIIITRRGLKLHKKLRVPSDKIALIKRDDWLRDFHKWRSTHG